MRVHRNPNHRGTETQRRMLRALRALSSSSVSLCLCGFLLLLTACQTAPQQPVAGQPITAKQEQRFEDWVAGFRADAAKAGIGEPTLARALGDIHANPRVIELDQSQPEFVKPVWEYLAQAVSDKRVADGRARLGANRATLDRVAVDYGVPPSVVVAFWGVESNYGSNVGSINVFEALATLGWSNPKRDRFARDELMAALRLADSGEVAPERMIGSWAGAVGQTQFLPSSYLRAAVDYDGNGRRDLWLSLPDVFASTANLLDSFGWRRGEPWGYEVKLPATFDYELAEVDVKKPLAEWARLGVRRIDGAPLIAAGDPPDRRAAEASILLPAGHRGPAFVTLDNFRAFLKYNNATAYALSVGQLADRIAGRGRVAASWPLADTPLSRSDTVALQTLLNARGCAAGEPDGLVGPATRRAVRCFQKTIGEAPDGYPTAALLDKLRNPPTG
jgi:membrane-bound lytic murein transglycosylase B